jgi:hypothetical protein
MQSQVCPIPQQYLVTRALNFQSNDRHAKSEQREELNNDYQVECTVETMQSFRSFDFRFKFACVLLAVCNCEYLMDDGSFHLLPLFCERAALHRQLALL